MRDRDCWLIANGREGSGSASAKSIYDPPPQRGNPAMTPDERLKMQKELNAARDRQGAASKAKAHPAPAQPAKP
jgi:hypothetical protein